MASFGQASGAFTESSAALRLLYVTHRNTVGDLAPDAYTQTNPPIDATTARISTSPGMKALTRGCLAGSVAFSRPDIGSNVVGGPKTTAVVSAMLARFIRPLGLFVNDVAGPFMSNVPAAASGKNTYTSSMGTMGTRLWETQALAGVTGVTAADALTYYTGMELIASVNGFLTPRLGVKTDLSAVISMDVSNNALEVTNGAAASTLLGILKVAPDSSFQEMVLDQRV